MQTAFSLETLVHFMAELLLCFLSIKFCAYPRLDPAKSGQQRAFFESRPPSRPQGVKNDPRPNVPDPLCEAVSVGRGRESDPRPLSCTFFDPSVHLPLSAVLNSPNGADWPHALDTVVSVTSSVLLPS